MDTVQDILTYSMDKNTDALKTAVDNVMSARAIDQIDAIRADYAAGIFGGTSEQSSVTSEQDLASTEGTTADENV